MRFSKADRIAETLTARIERGGYFSMLPGAPCLAKEFGASLTTIYNALNILEKSKIIVQLENGRFFPCNIKNDNNNLRITVLVPGGVYFFDRWLKAIRESALEYGCKFRTVSFLHRDDPVVFNTVNSDDFDVLFIYNYSVFTGMPLIMQRLHQISDKVVSLFYDDTKYGIRLLDGYDEKAMNILVKYLLKQKCGKTGFFCHESKNNRKRIATSSKILKRNGTLGEIHIFEQNSDNHAYITSYRKAKELLAAGAFRDHDAVICCTVPLAVGLARALRELNIRTPEDISLVSFGDPELAASQNPPLTGVGTPDPKPLVDEILKQYLGTSETPDRLVFTGNIPEHNPESILYKGASVKQKTT